MKPHIEEIVSLLVANEAPGSKEAFRKTLTELHDKVANAAASRDYPESIAVAIFNYVANHHSFDLDSIENARRTIDTILEVACPLATDDERSKELLIHLGSAVTKRLHRL